MHNIITSFEQVTPEWLTQLLYKKGYINAGSIVRVNEKAMSVTPTATNYRIEAVYSKDTPDKSFSSMNLFIKISKSDINPELGMKEVYFYSDIASVMSDLPITHCYDALYSIEEKKFHIILDDLHKTHFQPEWPLPPSVFYCKRIVDSLAKFHAYWWDNSNLAIFNKKLNNYSTQSALLTYGFNETEKMVLDMIDFLGDSLSTARRTLYQEILCLSPKLFYNRLNKKEGLTLIHGDAHAWNFLYPIDCEKSQVKIIDWQRWEVNIGAGDLAYLIALWWYPERRSLWERDLLKIYYDCLLKYGVKNYSWEDCIYDYKIGVVRNIFIPAWQWHNKEWAGLWWPHIENSILAFHDLNCINILE